ncbi:hypothetical protein GCM10023237_66030 [Streptomyces coeruleoprunus]|uniref:hypothetical protein n=1 Tax=Streptomyces coeruleoprunus TaxID=285563 RepID=UPI0031EEAD45
MRKIDSVSRSITTVAGNGSTGFGGDGGLAVNAVLNEPRSIAVDPGGDLYISDTGNNRVRKVSEVPVTAPFSVSPGGTATLERGTGKFGWPGVYVKALGSGGVAPQTVRVTLPAGKGLQFHGSGNLIVYGEDRDGRFGQLASYGGTLSVDKQTFTTDGPVDLHLGTNGKTNSLLIGVVAPADAVLGETKLTFTVGDRPPTSAPVNVTVGFSVSPGGTTTLERGKSAWPGVYAKALGDGGVAPQTVRVTLPPGKGLQFHGSGNLIVYGEDRDGHFGQLASYGGTLSADKQTFTTHGPVDLHLWKAQASNSLLIGLVAPADAVPGETKPTFTVGGQPPTSAPVNVT